MSIKKIIQKLFIYDGITIDKRIGCDNGATGTWDNDKWGVLVTNLSQRTK